LLQTIILLVGDYTFACWELLYFLLQTIILLVAEYNFACCRL